MSFVSLAERKKARKAIGLSCFLVLQRGLACICASREFGANKGIAQCAHWTMKAPPGFSMMIRVPTGVKKQPPRKGWLFFFGAPAGTRTPDTLLKRQVLYLLSYWGMFRKTSSQIETPQSGFDLDMTLWLGWRDSNPLYRSQSPVCYHYTTSQSISKPRPARPASARLQWGGIWGSNPRHPEPQSGALPTELIPPYLSARSPARPIINPKPKL